MSRSVNLSASSPQQGATISHFYKQTIFEKMQQGQLLHFEKERIHGDWASFSLGPFLSVDKKRCQRQIIYFCRRSVIKVFAPTGFLWPPITVEIIIIGQQSLFFQWQRMQRKICLWEMFWGQTSVEIRKTFFVAPKNTVCCLTWTSVFPSTDVNVF